MAEARDRAAATAALACKRGTDDAAGAALRARAHDVTRARVAAHDVATRRWPATGDVAWTRSARDLLASALSRASDVARRRLLAVDAVSAGVIDVTHDVATIAGRAGHRVGA